MLEMSHLHLIPISDVKSTVQFCSKNFERV